MEFKRWLETPHKDVCEYTQKAAKQLEITSLFTKPSVCPSTLRSPITLRAFSQES
jgi:hypothetical protein